MYDDVTREVEQFFYREARLLDERRFREWLELFTDDARYWMGGRSNRYPKTSKAIAIFHPERYVEEDVTREDEPAILDETKETLARRIARLRTGMAWAEAAVTHALPDWQYRGGARHAISEFTVYCNFIVFHSRAETEQDVYVGVRRDLLRRIERALRIARRKLTPDQIVLLAKNVSIFF